MAIKTLMIHLGVGRGNAAVLGAAADLSARLAGTGLPLRIVGIAACQPMQMIYAEGYTGAALADCQDELRSELGDAETEFRAFFKDSSAPVAWRSSYTTDPLPGFFASEARCADLIITSATTADAFDSARHANVGDLVLHAGRPVLIVPETAPRPTFSKIVIAWKDSPQARRAVADALPRLATASQVIVVEITDAEGLAAAQTRTRDVADWLASHGIVAATLAVAAHGDDANQLETVLGEQGCDLVVAGAYGHSRLREWVFGGVTRSLLEGKRCAMLSH